MTFVSTRKVKVKKKMKFNKRPLKLRNKPKMAYSRDALLENSKRQERDKTRMRLQRYKRDKRETREIWSYGGWPIIV